jgi:hypothetical protein
MPEEQQPELNQPAPAKNLRPRRRGHRGGRGRRRPAPPIPASGEPVESKLPRAEPPIRLREEMPVRPAPSKPFQPHSAPTDSTEEKFREVPRKNNPDISAISCAVHDVTEIVDSLRQALERMEEVLELVELAERQKIADEREIESLLRALRQFQSRGERPSRPERRERPERPSRPPRFERPPESVEPENSEPQPMD